MSTPQDDLVAGFLLERLPARLLTACKMLAGLEYPISDQHALMMQLRELACTANDADKPDAAAIELLAARLEPIHFPIVTARSALEKFHATRALRFGLEEGSDRDFVSRPDIAEIYEAAFGRLCAAEATEAYADAVVAGATEVQALVSGHMTGAECRRRQARALQDFIRRRREPQPGPWF